GNRRARARLGERDRLGSEDAGGEGGALVAAGRAGRVRADVDGSAEAGGGVDVVVLRGQLDVEARPGGLAADGGAAGVGDREVVERGRADREPVRGAGLAAGVVRGGDCRARRRLRERDRLAGEDAGGEGGALVAAGRAGRVRADVDR